MGLGEMLMARTAEERSCLPTVQGLPLVLFAQLGAETGAAVSQRREVTALVLAATTSSNHNSALVPYGRCPSTSPCGLTLPFEAPRKEPAAPQEAGDMGDQPCPLGCRDPKSHLRKVLKELSLLRLLKRTNRRILRLHAVAVQCWHSLAAQRLPGLLPVPPRMCHLTPKPQEVTEEAVSSPTTNTTSSKDVPMDPETGTLLGDPQPLAKNSGAGEAKEDVLGTLPQRFHLPAPKVLCRPSAQRWVKPCCTRSCGESLEHALTIHYPQ